MNIEELKNGETELILSIIDPNKVFKIKKHKNNICKYIQPMELELPQNIAFSVPLENAFSPIDEFQYLIQPVLGFIFLLDTVFLSPIFIEKSSKTG